MQLRDIVSKIEVWQDWKNNYGIFVPQFIQEAISKSNWSDWDKDVFYEYFERLQDQCIASMPQGYFSNEEKRKIKENWLTIALLLKQISESQDEPLFGVYQEIKNKIFAFTSTHKHAAVNRMIAGLQPRLLTTIVSSSKLNDLYNLLKEKLGIEIEGYTYSNLQVDSNKIWQLYKEAMPEKSVYEIMTLPWQSIEYLQELQTGIEDMTLNNQKIIDLLTYKKQIILQGPPGTGKTKLAKEIAQEMTRPKSVTIEDIKRLIKPGIVVKSIYDGIPYTVSSINEFGVTLRLENAHQQTRNYSHIIQAYTNYIERKPLEGGDAYQAAIAKYMYENWNSSSIAVVQFHPSYSYEDFVRGIVSKPSEKGTGIEYEAEDKLLSTIAKDALENYRLSQRSKEEVKKVIETKNNFENFAEKISEALSSSEEQKYFLTDKVYIFDVDFEKKRFKYKGDNWQAHKDGLNMNFSEVEKIIQSGKRSRNDITQMQDLAALTRSHATWYVSILEKYDSYLKSLQSSIDTSTIENETSLKNYILIIDEINRANLSSVLGELIYALEYRGEEVKSMYAVDKKNELILPPNFYIIGTMNTADRSVGHIDYAIRRRFAFVDVLPEDLSNNKSLQFEKELFDIVSKLFDTNLSPEFAKKDVQLGHSYFIDKAEEGGTMAIRLEYEIKPILMEYVKDGVLIGDVEGKPIDQYVQEITLQE